MTYDFANLEKITREEIAEATRQGANLGANPHAAALFNILVAGGGFGERGKSYKTIATALYTNDDTVCNRPTSDPGGRKASDNRNRGDTRVANLARGQGSFIPREAEAMHLAFGNVFGCEWRNAFSPHEVALSDPRALLRRIIISSLPWPSGLSPSTALAVLELAAQPGLTLQPVDPASLALSGNSGGDNAMLQTLDERPLYRENDRFLLRVGGINPVRDALFIFESSDAPLSFAGASDPCVLFSHRLIEPDSRRLVVSTAEGQPFTIYGATGGFAYVAVSFPKERDFSARFNVDPSAPRWNADAAGLFLSGLRRAMVEDPEGVKLVRHPYRVAL